VSGPPVGVCDMAIVKDREVEMRAGGVACRSAYADLLPCFHLVPGSNLQLAEVAVQGDVPVAMVDHNHLAVAVHRHGGILISREDDFPRRSRIHRLVTDVVVVSVVSVVNEILSQTAVPVRREVAALVH